MLALVLGLALAQDDLVPGTVNADPETLHAIGVQWLVSGDDDRDATVALRYREVGAATWNEGPPLMRVEPSTVFGWTVDDQFAGSVLDLPAGTSWEVELHAVDPDGLDQIEVVTVDTRAEPSDPASPNVVPVTDASGLSSALNNAQPGDVIELAAGTYAGTFAIYEDGTETNPIVIRGVDRDTVILDGGGTGGNVLEIYGSYTHLEQLTIQNANRALRHQGEGAVGNVVRRVLARDVNLGFGADFDQVGFTICDNELYGPIEWPHVYSDDGGTYSNVDGIVVYGNGHAVCHNKLVGWGDALKIAGDGSRSVDFYGNDIEESYDNAIELDGGEGNTRMWRNRVTNNYAPLSFQPVRGGPAYVVRNVVVNVAHENLKFHSLGGYEETSGILVWHNTFVRPYQALRLIDSTTSHNFELVGNLFVGPDTPDRDRAVEWTGDIDRGRFDGNGYWPVDYRFDFSGAGDWNTFADMQAAGTFEANGVALDGNTFASGYTPPPDYTSTEVAQDVTLSAGSPAVDSAMAIPGINDDYLGSGPDLGAWELGCPIPIYGPRPVGDDGLPGACDTGTSTPGTGTGTGTGTGGTGTGAPDSGTPSDGTGNDSKGCGCDHSGGSGWLGLLAALVVTRRRVGFRAKDAK